MIVLKGDDLREGRKNNIRHQFLLMKICERDQSTEHRQLLRLPKKMLWKEGNGPPLNGLTVIPRLWCRGTGNPPSTRLDLWVWLIKCDSWLQICWLVIQWTNLQNTCLPFKHWGCPKKKKVFIFFNINVSILNSKEFNFYKEPKINTVSDLVFLKNRTTAQQISFLLPRGKHNIAFCRNIAVGIPGGREIEHRQLSEQDFNRGFSGVEGDRHLPIIIIVATPIFLQM